MRSDMNTPWHPLTLTPEVSVDLTARTAVLPLPGLAVLALEGPESMKFLQGQTTADFREAEKGQVLPGAICSLKGRVLFSFVAVPDGGNVQLVMPADQIDAALTHLKKYAVFSKTQLADARAGSALLGMAGPGAEALVQQLTGSVPAPGLASHGPDGSWAIRRGDARFLVALPAATLAAQWPALSSQAVVAPGELWWAEEIRAGQATVSAATRDLFQPQELNFHVTGAVSYEKGCYTGQEVVARLYFRGRLKQRLYHLHCETPADGSAIFAAGHHVGDVVMQAHDGTALELLAVVKNEAVRNGGLTLGENGPALTLQALPYALPADKEE
jgi:folate-binding protein YgfZ